MIVIVPSKVYNVFEDWIFWLLFLYSMCVSKNGSDALSVSRSSELDSDHSSSCSSKHRFIWVFLHLYVCTHTWSHVTKSWCKGENNDRKKFWGKIASRWKNIETDPIIEKSVAQGRKQLGLLQWGLREFLNIRPCRTIMVPYLSDFPSLLHGKHRVVEISMPTFPTSD